MEMEHDFNFHDANAAKRTQWSSKSTNSHNGKIPFMLLPTTVSLDGSLAERDSSKQDEFLLVLCVLAEANVACTGSLSTNILITCWELHSTTKRCPLTLPFHHSAADISINEKLWCRLLNLPPTDGADFQI